ncbi:MAG: ABC transporter ATP-binding protein [Chloroflexota bacterium]|nr:ABC transporter ATP-binding protein [Chloroflexota bacterium]
MTSLIVPPRHVDTTPTTAKTALGRIAGEMLLEVRDLQVRFDRRRRPPLRVVDGVGFSVRRGTVVGIVGESGSGKSMTSNAVMGLVPPPGRVVGGTITFGGEDLLTKSEAAMRRVRGKRIAMIFQNPMTALNPAFTIGRQMSDMLVFHEGVSREVALERSAEGLRRVGIPAVERQLVAYPHQLSGGMRQRVLIAMALSCAPELLIADEPTTALDVTIQAQILELLDQIAADPGRAIVLISHDFGVIARLCDEVVVMYRGNVVESGTTERVLTEPEHPYTQALLGAIPRPGARGQRLETVDEQLAATPAPRGGGGRESGGMEA